MVPEAKTNFWLASTSFLPAPVANNLSNSWNEALRIRILFHMKNKRLVLKK